MASYFWEPFIVNKRKLISKVVILPSRPEVGFSFFWKPLVAFKMLGLSGVLKLIHFKVFSKKVILESVCDECVKLTSLDPETLYKEVSKSDFDVLISVGAPVVFRSDLLSLPILCSINIHNGDIRKYRGHFSTFWEIINGEDFLCLTLHEMTIKVDSGFIYDQKFRSKNSFSSFWEIMVWKKKVGGEMLARNLDLLINGVDLHEQCDLHKNLLEPKHYSFPTIRDVLRFRF